jgi:hypothetical protein
LAIEEHKLGALQAQLNRTLKSADPDINFAERARQFGGLDYSPVAARLFRVVLGRIGEKVTLANLTLFPDLEKIYLLISWAEKHRQKILQELERRK